MKVHEIRDLSNHHAIELLIGGLSRITGSNIIENYHPDYSHLSSNLFYILGDPGGRYRNGCYYILENADGDYVASAGWNEYPDIPSTAIALSRAYVAPKYRTRYHMGEYILPRIIDSTDRYENVYITSNTYNSAIYQYFVRSSQGKRAAMYADWPDIYKKFKPIGLHKIYYTDQYVAKYDK